MALTLSKEEVPIFRHNGFYPPIHPKLLEPCAKIDRDLAHLVFGQAAQEWYSDLKRYVENLEDTTKKEWFEKVFLKKKPKVVSRYGRQELNILGWADYVNCGKNGFAEVLSISRDAGGSLYCSGELNKTYAIIDDPRGVCHTRKRLR